MQGSGTIRIIGYQNWYSKWAITKSEYHLGIESRTCEKQSEMYSYLHLSEICSHLHINDFPHFVLYQTNFSIYGFPARIFARNRCIMKHLRFYDKLYSKSRDFHLKSCHRLVIKFTVNISSQLIRTASQTVSAVKILNI